MFGVLQGMATRARHICRQTGARLCNHSDCADDHSCSCCCCWPTSNGSSNSTHSSSSSSSNNSCRSRHAGLCCGWLYSLIFGWDWLPLATSDSPVSRTSGQPQGGVLGSTASSVSGGVGAGGIGGGSDIAMAVASSGDGGGMGMRRLASSSSSSGSGGGGGGGEDVKPLLTHSKSAEFREKEKRFIKGRFVLPGSDVQRRIADAMAGMLAAGGRAMTGTDGTSNSAGAVGQNRNAHSAPASEGKEDYREGVDQDTRMSEGGESGFQFSTSTSLSSLPPSASPSSQEAASRAGGAIGAGSRHASPRRDPSSRRDAGYVISGVGSGGGRGVEEQQQPEDERECVICMEEFSKDDPEMLTLCSCGVNKTFFHYSCLLQWLSKHSYCPACRGYLFFEERRPGGNRSQGDSNAASTAPNNTRGGSGRSGTSRGTHSGSTGAREGFHTTTDEASLSSDEYGRAFRRALRAGLDHPLSSPRRGEGGAEP